MNNHHVAPDLAQKLDTLPDRPGVYIYRSADGKVIYVGKAVVLKNRVRSYFHEAARHEPRTRRLVAEIADLEWIVTDTELEALILENELIKRYHPRFNVRLRDDKTYPYIKIHWQEDFPKISIVRRMDRDGGRYYGPFTSAYAVRQTLDVLRRVFPYLDCNREITGNDPKPCLYYHIKRCAGPCIGAVDKDGYRQVVAGLAAFLEGDSEKVLEQLNARMQFAAENLQFERAAQLRDQIRAAQQIVERQKIVSGKQEDEDIIAFAQDERTGEACVQVFFIRRGKLIGRESFILEGVPADANGELIGAFVKQFYDEAAFVPPTIVLPKDLDERKIIEQWLRGRRGGQKVTLAVPKRGPKQELLQLATENAAATLQSLQAQWQADTNRQTQAITELQEALGLEAPPSRIECFDISTLQGTNTVGSMVVFAKGAPVKSDYRRFNVKGRGSQGEPDDYASMREVLRRRFRRALEQNVPDPGAQNPRERCCMEGAARPADRRRRQGAVGRGRRGACRVRADRSGAGRRPGQTARGAVPARPKRSGSAAPGHAGPLPCPAHPRRSPPLCHHRTPREAREGVDHVGAGRDPRHRADAAPSPAAALRLARSDP